MLNKMLHIAQKTISMEENTYRELQEMLIDCKTRRIVLHKKLIETKKILNESRMIFQRTKEYILEPYEYENYREGLVILNLEIDTTKLEERLILDQLRDTARDDKLNLLYRNLLTYTEITKEDLDKLVIA